MGTSCGRTRGTAVDTAVGPCERVRGLMQHILQIPRFATVGARDVHSKLSFLGPCVMGVSDSLPFPAHTAGWALGANAVCRRSDVRQSSRDVDGRGVVKALEAWHGTRMTVPHGGFLAGGERRDGDTARWPLLGHLRRG